MRLSAILAFTGSMALMFSPALGQHIHEGDVELITEGLAIHTHGGVGDRVFEGELDDVFATASDPGFDSEDGTFAISSSVGFNLLEPLQIWNGAGFDVLAPATEPTMRVELLGFQADTAEGFVSGFDLPVDSSGKFHRHYNFTLLDNGGGIPPGIYLLTMEMTSTDPLIGDSPPFWLVWGYQGEEEQHEAAVDWVYLNYVVPEPGAAALICLAIPAILGRRSRAQ